MLLRKHVAVNYGRQRYPKKQRQLVPRLTIDPSDPFYREALNDYQKLLQKLTIHNPPPLDSHMQKKGLLERRLQRLE